jgi:hypothetical protein
MTTGLPRKSFRDIVFPLKVVRVNSGAARFTMVTPLRPVMGCLFSMPHTKSPKNPTATIAARTKVDFRKKFLASIYLINPNGPDEKCRYPQDANKMPCVQEWLSSNSIFFCSAFFIFFI